MNKLINFVFFKRFMKAEILTYETKKMTNSERSIISKRLFGYKDQTKKAKYVYQRKGILQSIPHLIITKKTFVIRTKDVKRMKDLIRKLGATVKSWGVDINEKKLKKTSV